MSIITPNMSLVESTINIDSGLQWEQNLNSSLTIIDGHNHSPGYGVQIGPSGLNINADLPINGNNLTIARSVNLQAQTSPLNLAADIGCLYVSGVDLYFNDENGNQIKMTSGGTVNATSTGISSGTATASFVSSVLVVNAASNTPANIQAGSILIGNNLSGSKFLTLAPPSAMAANYTVTLPALPASQKFMALDASGNMSAPWTVDNSTIEISSGNIQVKDAGITTAKIADASITKPKLAALGYQVSANSGVFTTSSTTAGGVTVPSQTVTIPTTGRPVSLQLISGSNNTNEFGGIGVQGPGSSTFGIIYFYRDGTLFAQYIIETSATGGPLLLLAVPQISTVDLGAGAGSHTYVVKASVSASTTMTYQYLRLFAYEL